jgi:hypothetical protein
MVYWPLVDAQSTKYLIFAIYQKMVAWTVELLYEVVLPLENNLAWCKICADTFLLDYRVHTCCSEGSRRERKLMQRHLLREHLDIPIKSANAIELKVLLAHYDRVVPARFRGGRVPWPEEVRREWQDSLRFWSSMMVLVMDREYLERQDVLRSIEAIVTDLDQEHCFVRHNQGAVRHD